MKQSEFIERLKQFESCKTLYVTGAFGAVASEYNKNRYMKNDKKRASKIKNASSDTFFADCCGLIKGILWGWKGDTSNIYGGAEYKSNNVPDLNEAGLLALCTHTSADFSNIADGEFVYMKGHCGVYIGDGVVIESTPAWDCGVQKTGLGNRGVSVNGKTRMWEKHGRLPWIEYDKVPTPHKYNIDDFRSDVKAILHVNTCAEAFEKTITISTIWNKSNALVTPLERYFRSLGYYEGDIEADKGQRPWFGAGMKEATKKYQRNIVGSTGKNVDGVLTAKAQTWKKLLLG